VKIEDEEQWSTMLRCGKGCVWIVEEKGFCRHVVTPTLKSLSERGGYLGKVLKSAVYREGDAESPLYRLKER
jgi:hypothetical protein